jgi:hypothetical protein
MVGENTASSIDPIARDMAIETAKVLVPFVYKKRDIIREKINAFTRRITKNGISFDFSIYLSTFIRFKTGYALEDITGHICRLLDNYRIEKEPNKIRYNDVIFEVVTENAYSANVYATDELLDYYDLYADEEEILVPAVVAISIYVIPESSETNDIKKQLMEGYCFLELMEKNLLDYHIVEKGNLLYIVNFSDGEENNMRKLIQEKMHKYNETIKFIPARENEIKIKLDKLVAARLGEILNN